MSMSSRNDSKWNDIFSFSDDNERLEHEADMISLKIAMSIERLIEEHNLTKKEFAQKIGTSPAYITQVLRGDKRINMVFLAKVLQNFNVTFDIDFHFINEIDSKDIEKVFDYARKFNETDRKCNIVEFKDFLSYTSKQKAVR